MILLFYCQTQVRFQVWLGENGNDMIYNAYPINATGII